MAEIGFPPGMGFKTTPFPHQLKEYLEHRDKPARALLWQMRTGKTKAIIDLVCYRYLIKKDIDKVLVVAPNGVHLNWVLRELPTHMWDSAPYNAHAWVSSESHKLQQVDSLARVFVPGRLNILAVNSESLVVPRVLQVVEKFLETGRTMLVVDESHDFRTPGSARSKVIRKLASKCSVKRILTGTAVSNTPLAAWSQFEILGPGALGFTTFGKFEAHFASYTSQRMRSGRFIPILEGYRNLAQLQASLASWSSVVLRKDCEGLPDLMRTVRYLEMEAGQQAKFRELKKKMLLEIGNAYVEAIEGGARLTKLQQVTQGFAIDSTGQVHEMVPDASNPRLQALEEEVLGSEGKVIIWCKFREDIRRVTHRLTSLGLKSVEYHGAIHSQQTRQAAIDSFQRDPSVKAFVGQPRAGGTGLNLSAASTVIWYSHTFDLIEREQAMERATRIGGAKVAVVDLVMRGGIDEYILETLAAKRDVASSLAGEGLKNLLEMLG